MLLKNLTDCNYKELLQVEARKQVDAEPAEAAPAVAEPAIARLRPTNV